MTRFTLRAELSEPGRERVVEMEFDERVSDPAGTVEKFFAEAGFPLMVLDPFEPFEEDTEDEE